MKIMGLDYGRCPHRRGHFRLTMYAGWLHHGAASRNEEKLLADVVRLTKENGVGTIVVGLPRNMDGTEGPRAEVCRAFAEKVKAATGVDVEMWDERRTTVEAHQILSDHNYHGKKRKNTVDAVAASLILEGYLAYRRR